MLNSEKNFFDVKKKLPEQCQRVLAYNNKLGQFIDAIFVNGKFYERDNELINITKWAELRNRLNNGKG